MDGFLSQKEKKNPLARTLLLGNLSLELMMRKRVGSTSIPSTEFITRYFAHITFPLWQSTTLNYLWQNGFDILKKCRFEFFGRSTRNFSTKLSHDKSEFSRSTVWKKKNAVFTFFESVIQVFINIHPLFFGSVIIIEVSSFQLLFVHLTSVFGFFLLISPGFSSTVIESHYIHRERSRSSWW